MNYDKIAALYFYDTITCGSLTPTKSRGQSDIKKLSLRAPKCRPIKGTNTAAIFILFIIRQMYTISEFGHQASRVCLSYGKCKVHCLSNHCLLIPRSLGAHWRPLLLHFFYKWYKKPFAFSIHESWASVSPWFLVRFGNIRTQRARNRNLFEYLGGRM